MAVFNFNKRQRDHEKDMQDRDLNWRTSEAREGRYHGTSERRESQQFSREERKDTQRFGAKENKKGRKFTTAERKDTQNWRSGEADKERTFADGQGEKDRGWRTRERKDTQGWQTGERESSQGWQTGERKGTQKWQTRERKGSSKDRVRETREIAEIPRDQELRDLTTKYGAFGVTKEEAARVARLEQAKRSTSKSQADSDENENRSIAARSDRPYIGRRLSTANMRKIREDEAGQAAAEVAEQESIGAFSEAASTAKETRKAMRTTAQRRQAADYEAVDSNLDQRQGEAQVRQLNAQSKYYEDGGGRSKGVDVDAIRQSLNGGKPQADRPQRISLNDPEPTPLAATNAPVVLPGRMTMKRPQTTAAQADVSSALGNFLSAKGAEALGALAGREAGKVDSLGRLQSIFQKSKKSKKSTAKPRPSDDEFLLNDNGY